MGRLDKIWIKRFHKGPMDLVAEATLEKGEGIKDNANRSRKREVTLLEKENWESIMESMGADLDPTARRANLYVEGVGFDKSRRYKTLQIGATKIFIWGELKPCRRMEETLEGLYDELYPEWKGGAYGEVLEGGIIREGDTIEWIDS